MLGGRSWGTHASLEGCVQGLHLSHVTAALMFLVFLATLAALAGTLLIHLLIPIIQFLSLPRLKFIGLASGAGPSPWGHYFE